MVVIGALVGTSFSLFTYNAPGRKVNTIVTGGINLDESGANEPELLSNMIPVYYDETNNVWKKADEKNMNRSHKWYDYNNKMWANAVTTAEEGYTIGTTENDKVVNINNQTSYVKSYTSSNKGINNSTSSSKFTFTAGSDGTYSFDWSISSEEDKDTLSITENGSILIEIATSGVKSGKYTGTVKSGTTYTIIVRYYKNGSESKYEDIATIGNFVLPSGSTEITHTVNSSFPDYQWKDTSFTANKASTSYKIVNGKFELGKLSSGSLVNKYMCSDGVSTTCDTLYLIKEATGNMVSKVDSYSDIKKIQVRNDYLNASVGTPIPMDDINTMWVWIPRFIATGDTTTYNGTNDINNPGAFDITFVDNTTTAHDAFTFGTQELNGFWMGKFEISHKTLVKSTTFYNLECSTDTCSNANGIIIKPNVKSLRYNNTRNYFYAILSMKQNENPFGFDTAKDPTLDTHMIKNSEWGAVAYLTQSIYGRCSSSTNCTEVGINNSDFITGYGAPAGSSYSVTNGAYTTSLGMGASTTENIYGAYDMSGGASEFVMATSEKNVSDFPDSKYYNSYTYQEYTSSGLQHALTETRTWYGDMGSFADIDYPWFYRGGISGEKSKTGIFHYGYYVDSYGLFGSRAILVK